MTIISDRIHSLEAWIESYSRTAPHVLQFPVQTEALDSIQVIKALREKAKEHLADNRERGVYAWFWLDGADQEPWPLYVGKSQRGQSCFLARTNAHLSHAFRGVDSLYARKKDRADNPFHRTHQAGTSPSNDHSIRLCQQFNGMRILFLPMNEHDASELAGKAEALILSAVLRWHAESEGTGKYPWDRVMNSSGRTLSSVESDDLVRNAMSALKRWFLIAPRSTAGTRIGDD